MSDFNEEDLKKNMKDKDTWIRFVYLVLFGGVFYVTSMVTFAIAIFQFFAKLFSGASFNGLADFGENLATYQAQLSRYLAFASDEKPFPFSDFPAKKCKVEVIPPTSANQA